MDKKELLKSYLKDILDFIGVKNDFSIDYGEENLMKVVIYGENLNYLIGFRGQSLDALQTLLGQILHNKVGEWTPVVVDINDYKDKRTDKLHDMAKVFIDRVRFFQTDYELPPMKAWERKKIHELVTEYDDVVSESTGEGLNRRIVIKPKNRKTS